MKARCTKLMCAHWSVFFEQGKWYNISEIKSKEFNLIKDKNKYIESLKVVAKFLPDIISSGPNVSKGLLDDQKNALRYTKDQYLVNVDLDYYLIKGDDGSSHQFVVMTREELLNNYKTDNFENSVNIFEDYFESINEVRNSQIDLIVND